MTTFFSQPLAIVAEQTSRGSCLISIRTASVPNARQRNADIPTMRKRKRLKWPLYAVVTTSFPALAGRVRTEEYHEQIRP